MYDKLGLLQDVFHGSYAVCIGIAGESKIAFLIQ